MLTEKNIKGELTCRSLKFTSVSSLCYKHKLYPLKQVSVFDVTPSLCKNKTGRPLDTEKEIFKEILFGLSLKMTFNIWQETFCGNFRSKFLARGGVRGNLASYKHV